AGFPRGVAETPREYATRVADAGFAGSDVLERLTELYTASRFGGRTVEAEVLRDVAHRLSRLGSREGSLAAKLAPGARGRPPSRQARMRGISDRAGRRGHLVCTTLARRSCELAYSNFCSAASSCSARAPRAHSSAERPEPRGPAAPPAR